MFFALHEKSVEHVAKSLKQVANPKRFLLCDNCIVVDGQSWGTLAVLVNSLLAGLLISALVFIQCCISGTRMVFSLLPYTLIASAAVLSFVASRNPATPISGGCLAARA